MTNKEFLISKFAYRELSYFCLRYNEYKTEINTILNSNSSRNDPTADTAIKIERLSRKREMIEQTALEVDSEIYQPLLHNVTTGVTYEQMKACGIEILCGRRQFYEKRRKFYWLLNFKKG